MRVLIIGDSLSDGTGANPGTFGVPPSPPRTPGQMVGRNLTQRGDTVRIQAKGGRSAHHFVVYDDGLAILEQEVREHRPDRVVIILGTNDSRVRTDYTQSAFIKMKQVFDRAGIPVYHVGPPLFADGVVRDGKSLNDLAAQVVTIGKTVFGDNFIDARPMTSDTLTVNQGRSSDFIHFATSGAERWAGRLTDALVNLPEKNRYVKFIAIGGFIAVGITAAYFLAKRGK